MTAVNASIFDAYLAAALWTEQFDDLGFTIFDFDKESRDAAREDCAAFVEAAGPLIEASGLLPAQIGHDFWLTRNGHGAGFWDRGLGDVGDQLSDIACEFPERNVYAHLQGLGIE